MPRKNILYICAAAGAFIAITSYAAFVETSVKNRPVVQVETKTLKDEAPSFLPAGKKWKLVWHDEFNGNRQDKMDVPRILLGARLPRVCAQL